MNYQQRFSSFVNGEFLTEAASSIEVFEPASGRVYAELLEANTADLQRAMDAGETAQQKAARWGPAERSRCLHRIADAIESNLEGFAETEAIDTGKPISLARTVDIPRAISNFRFFAAMAESFCSQAHNNPNAWNLTLRPPLGVVACISPWNLPLYLLTWKLAPALACGNAVIAKPSEVTPATAQLLGQTLQSIDFPAGLLQILQGRGARIGSSLVTHPRVQAVSFTGSTATGAAIAQSLASSFKRTSLELGGKNALIVCADVDIEKTADEVIRASFSNQGQICLCASRILIERSIYAEFKAALLSRVEKLVPADPMLPNTRFGALVSKAHLDKVQSAIQTAEEEGGRRLCGGQRTQLEGRCSGGYFLPPTIFELLPQSSETNQREIFGPVITLSPFIDDRDAVLQANATPYGLASSVYCRDNQRALNFAAELEVGMVWINCWMHRDLRTPFGGVKQSGLGREGGLDAMQFFSGCKNVSLAL